MKNKNRKHKIINRIIGLIFIFLIVSYFIPTPYMLVKPGIAQELSPLVTVENAKKGEISGAFMLTAVQSKRATIFDLVKVFVTNPEGVEITPFREQLPEDMEMEEYIKIMGDLMEESKLKAQAVAFEKAGYDYKVSGKGAEVVEVMKDGSASDKLKNGDIIQSIDGKKVELATDAVQLIRSHDIGEKVNIKVKRDDKIKSYQLKTIEIENQPGKPSVGIFITTKDLNYEFPRNVKFDTRNIIGPSAGGVFTLEIYNQLSDKDITGGQRIAGTGTIASDGTIGRIDGILQKIIAADKARADLFFVPKENYETAQKTTRDIKLVSIENIDDALDYLKKNVY